MLCDVVTYTVIEAIRLSVPGQSLRLELDRQDLFDRHLIH